MKRTTAAGVTLAVALAAGVVIAVAQAPDAPGAEPPWRTFGGSWVVTGQAQTVPVEDGRTAATLQVSGAVVLKFGEGLSRGFRGEAIAFDDGPAVGVGRFVWTDEHGDRIFGRLAGDRLETGGRFSGTFTGGTGRYARITGDFTFDWQYVVQSDEGAFEGRTVGLAGRFRRAAGRP